MQTKGILKKTSLLLLLNIVAILLIMMSSTIGTVNATSLPEIQVCPSVYNATTLGEIVTVDVNIGSASNLQGFEFKLGYNTAILDGLQVVEGSFLESFGTTYAFKLEIDETLGFAWVAVSLLGTTSAQGDGTLATVSFECTGIGEAIFDLYDTKLGRSETGGTDHYVTDGCSTHEFVDPPKALMQAATAPLYAGGSVPGVVYEYLGGTSWQTISPPLEPGAVLCLCEYEGQLYAGTDGSSGVWRYDGDTTWTVVSDPMDYQVCSLIVFRGNLYAGTAGSGGRLYRYDGGTTWTRVVDHAGWDGFRSLYVWNDILYLGDYGYDILGHYDGTTFTEDADLGGSCIWDFEVFENSLYASAWAGRLHRSSDGSSWTTIRMFQGYDSWELETFQGYLYVTTGPNLERYDGVDFSLVWTVPDGNEIISMINSGDALILGTGGEAGYYGNPGVGKVYAFDGMQVQLISNELGSGIQTLLVSGVQPENHDVAVTDVAPYEPLWYQGDPLPIFVDVVNQGDFAETFNVTAFYGDPFLTPEQWNIFASMGDINRDGCINLIDAEILADNFGWEGPPGANPCDLNSDGEVDIFDAIILSGNMFKCIWEYFGVSGGFIGTQTVNLPPQSLTTLIFMWDTTTLDLDNYTIGAYADVVPGEINEADNKFTDGVVTIVTALSGVVTDEYTQEPVQGVTISICETSESTVTDEYGEYSFTIWTTGIYTVEMTVPYGYLTHDDVTKFVEITEATEVNFTLYQAAWSGATVPRTIGYWKNWDKHYTTEMMETFITHVRTASGLFSDLTINNVESYLTMRGKNMTEKTQTQLLASWLNVVSAQLGVDAQVDLSSIEGWEQVITIPQGSILTVDELLGQIDNLYLTNAELTQDQWEIVKDILDSLNNSQLFIEE